MNRWRFALLGVISGAGIGVVILHDRIAQDRDYHEFADQRDACGIPRFLAVVSNAAFVIAGDLGWRNVRRRPRGALPGLARPYQTFFASGVLLAVGSAFYHLRPDNERLVIDRLSMVPAFAALDAIVIGEHLGEEHGRRVLPIILLGGVASVLYWHVTERNGRGDLRPYILFQFLQIAILPAVILLFRSKFSSVRHLWSVIALHAAAKVFEQYDKRIYEATRIVSGHTLKHIAAGAAMAVLANAVKNREVERVSS